MFKEFYNEVTFNDSKPYLETLRGKVGDTKSRGLYVTVIQNNVIIDDLTDLSMDFVFIKPDGTRGINEGVVAGERFRIDYTNQVFAVAGTVKGELVLRGASGEKITSRDLTLLVTQSIVDGEIISKDERGILDKAFELAEDIIPRIELLDIELLEDVQDRVITKVAKIEKELNDYKSTMASVNVNQEAKQNVSGYGVVSLPKNSANGQVSVSVKGNTEITEDGTKSTISASRLKSVDSEGNNAKELYLPNVGELRSLPNGVKDEIRVSGGKAKLVKRVKKYVLQESDILLLSTGTPTYVDIITIRALPDFSALEGTAPYSELSTSRTIGRDTPGYDLETSYWKHAYDTTKKIYIYIPKGTYANLAEAKNDLEGTRLTYQLAEPIITPINVSGNLISYPSGTVYIEHGTYAVGLYGENGITVTESELPIKEINKITKIDYETGLEHELDTSKATVSEDGLLFTHEDLEDGDIVFFDYDYSTESTQGETTIEYYDSRYVIEDTENGNFYQWKISSTNGTPNIELVEV